jgi:hypothetical protein
MHKKVLTDNVVKLELLRKTGPKAQPFFVLGGASFFELIFFKKNEVTESFIACHHLESSSSRKASSLHTGYQRRSTVSPG